jgi:hypothetical protein
MSSSDNIEWSQVLKKEARGSNDDQTKVKKSLNKLLVN